jgi:hypothetical protein
MIKINKGLLKTTVKEADGITTYYPTTTLYQVQGSEADAPLLLSTSWDEDLVKALLRDYTLQESIMIAIRACKACKLLLANQYGLPWGRDERSDEWKQCLSRGCLFCIKNDSKN